MNSFIHSGFHIVKPTILIQCPLFSGVSLFFQCSPHYNFPFVLYFLTIHYEMIVLYKWLIYFWACSLFCRINNFVLKYQWYILDLFTIIFFNTYSLFCIVSTSKRILFLKITMISDLYTDPFLQIVTSSSLDRSL